MLLIVFTILLVILALAVGLAPRSTEVVGSQLLVHTWIKTFHYALGKVNSYQVLDSSESMWTNTIRVFAVGWPLKPYGWVWNRNHGLMLAMASDPHHQVLLTMTKGLLLISPDSEGKLFGQLRQQRPAQF